MHVVNWSYQYGVAWTFLCSTLYMFFMFVLYIIQQYVSTYCLLLLCTIWPSHTLTLHFRYIIQKYVLHSPFHNSYRKKPMSKWGMNTLQRILYTNERNPIYETKRIDLIAVTRSLWTCCMVVSLVHKLPIRYVSNFAERDNSFMCQLCFIYRFLYAIDFYASSWAHMNASYSCFTTLK